MPFGTASFSHHAPGDTICRTFRDPVSAGNHILVTLIVRYGHRVQHATDSGGNVYTRVTGRRRRAKRLFRHLWPCRFREIEFLAQGVGHAPGGLTVAVSGDARAMLDIEAHEVPREALVFK
jgi:hypothetical protein